MTSETDPPKYVHSDEDALRIGAATLTYIMTGNSGDAVRHVCGAAVYGVVRMLRENDELLHSEPPVLDADQRLCLARVEETLDDVFEGDLQYYPFGHRRASYQSDEVVAGLKVRAGLSSWWRSARVETARSNSRAKVHLPVSIDSVWEQQ